MISGIKSVCIVLVLILFSSFPLITDAATWERKDVEYNQLHVEGTCNEHIVTVYLYPPGKSQPVYSAGAICENGHFVLTDDVSAWEVTIGEYEITVGEGQRLTAPERAHKNQFTVLEKIREIFSPNDSTVPTVSPTPSGASLAPTDPDSVFIAAQGRFEEAVQILKEALQDMSAALPHTTLADSAKVIWSSILETMEQAMALLHPPSLQPTDAPVATVSLASPLPSSTPTPSASPSPSVTPPPTPSPTLEPSFTPEIAPASEEPV